MHLGNEDFLALGELAKIREARWSEQRRHLARGSAFYRRLWEGRPPPETLDELPACPLTTKQMLRDSQVAHPPFGDYLAATPERIKRIHRSSGTTGRAVTTALSASDAARNAEAGGRSFRACGLGPGHIAVHCLNFQLWVGGLSDHLSLEATGCSAVPFGVGASELLIETIRALGITAIHCTPSYPAVLEQVIAERFPGLAPRDLGLKLGLLVGEAGLENPAFRARVEETWGFEGRNAYGMSEALSTMAGQCAHSADMHFVAFDLLHHELVDPETEAPLAWRDGTRGELVLTHVAKECQPLVRFRTRDIIEITATETCACGRSTPRFRVLGRSDDMIVVRGVNVFPSAVAIALHRFPELSGEFRIDLDGPPPFHRLPLAAELAAEREATPALAAAVAEAVKSQTGASAEVSLLPASSLPRTGGKSKRVYRRE